MEYKSPSPSFWLGRTPSFDGIHALDLPSGMMMRNPAGEDFIVTTAQTWEWVRNKSPLDVYPEIQLKKIDQEINKYQETPPDNTPQVKRPRGRPPKQPKQQSKQTQDQKGKPALSAWQLFVKSTIPTLPKNLTSQEQMKECARLWAHLKASTKLQST